MHDRVGSSLFHQSWNQAVYIRLMSNPSPSLSIENLNRFEVHHGSKFQPKRNPFASFRPATNRLALLLVVTF